MNYIFWTGVIVPLIHSLAVLSLALFIISISYSHRVDKVIKKKSEREFKKTMYYMLDIPYTVFIALISIFPLLGMLGTVLALLSLDISGDTEILKNNFFQALDTTMWGIVYASLFKFFNSIFQTYIEAQITKTKRMLEKSYN